ncbi:MAG: hypothetical protein D3905_03910 [Candidatus Electrothrix sp. AS4_5]|nr:hypothetical protein [Candidatus Electrothrix gigas]
MFLLLTVLICIIYSNTLNADWHLDDKPNILLNSQLHLTDVHPKSLANTLISGSNWSNPKFYRPVSCFTFALNWYFGQDNPIGYHIVNIAIHIITTFVLFLVLLQIMRLTDATQEEESKNYFIALLGAALWATAPIQTQAITYIVQRMASLATMFTLLALYSYLKARTEEKYIRWVVLCILFFLAGIGSKENSVMLPASLLLLEFSFFRHHISKQKIGWIAVTSFVMLLAGLLAMHFFFGKNLLDIFDPSRLVESYAGRSFTLSERLLTEPRIVLMYISQIFIPLVSRLSLVHDIQVSTSLFTPWTTLPAIAVIFTLITLSMRYLKKYPLVAFPVLFFFLNHIIESTVLPLELIFEHRNYLPSLFIFLPLSIFIAHAIYAPSKFSFVGRFAIATGTVCFLILAGHATYTRNFAWANEGTLWTDGIEKAPSSPRAAGYLGQWYQKIEKPQKAYYYFRLALQNSYLAPTPKKSQVAASQSLGLVHYESEEYKKAIPYFSQCIDIEKNNQNCLTNRARSYLQLNLPQKALDDADILVADYPTYLLGKYIAASASYQLRELASAQKYMHGIIRKSLDKPKGLYLMGLILLKEKSYPNALFFIHRAARLWPSKAEYQFSLAAAYYVNNQLDTAEQTLRNIFNRYPLPVIDTALQNFKPDAPSQESLNFTQKFLAKMLREEM